MKMRKHIGLFFVLVSSAILFAHAFIPHHHHTESAGICLTANPACAHGEHDAQGLAWHDTCHHCRVEACSSTLLFTFSHSANFGMEFSPVLTWLTVCELAVPEPDLNEDQWLNPTEPYLIPQYVLENLPRRGPPVLV